MCTIKYCQRKKSNMTTDISGLLKMECYTKEKRLFIVDQYFKNITIFSDQADFRLNSLVNRKNRCIWSSENPRVIVKEQMHQQHANVWCRILAGGISGPFFYENTFGQAIINNSARCRDMKITFFANKSQDMNANDCAFNKTAPNSILYRYIIAII